MQEFDPDQLWRGARSERPNRDVVPKVSNRFPATPPCEMHQQKIPPRRASLEFFRHIQHYLRTALRELPMLKRSQFRRQPSKSAFPNPLEHSMGVSADASLIINSISDPDSAKSESTVDRGSPLFWGESTQITIRITKVPPWFEVPELYQKYPY